MDKHGCRFLRRRPKAKALLKYLALGAGTYGCLLFTQHVPLVPFDDYGNTNGKNDYNLTQIVFFNGTIFFIAD